MLRTKKAPSLQTGNYTGATCHCQPRGQRHEARWHSRVGAYQRDLVLRSKGCDIEQTIFIQGVEKGDAAASDVLDRRGPNPEESEVFRHFGVWYLEC